jgi:hypothetical protein
MPDEANPSGVQKYLESSAQAIEFRRRQQALAKTEIKRELARRLRFQWRRQRRQARQRTLRDWRHRVPLSVHHSEEIYTLQCPERRGQLTTRRRRSQLADDQCNAYPIARNPTCCLVSEQIVGGDIGHCMFHDLQL